MKHFTNFGYVRDTNKQLKRLNDLQGVRVSIPNKSRLIPSTRETGLGNIAGRVTNSSKQVVQEALENKLSAARAVRQDALRLQDPLTKPIRHSYNEYDAPPVLPKTGWSDIRKTDDRAASPTGYLGFRTDPYKGYGGMMEEPIPKPDLYPDGMSQTVKKYASRLTRKEVN